MRAGNRATRTSPTASPVSPRRRPTTRDRVVWWSNGSAVNSVPRLRHAVLRQPTTVAARAEIRRHRARYRPVHARRFGPGPRRHGLRGLRRGHRTRRRARGDLVIFSRGGSRTAFPRRAATRSSRSHWSTRGCRTSPTARSRARSASTSASVSTDGSGFGARDRQTDPQASNTTASLPTSSRPTRRPTSSTSRSTTASASRTRRADRDKSGLIAAGYGATLREIRRCSTYYLPTATLLGVAAQSYRDVQQRPLLLALGATVTLKAAQTRSASGPWIVGEGSSSSHCERADAGRVADAKRRALRGRPERS